MRKRQRGRGHFCWCCGRIRANERFSGHGHARHLCTDCSKLSKEELAYRQAARDIDRLLDWNGIVRRKQRKSFKRFLSHSDERVRRYAEEVAAHDLQVREACRRERTTEEAEELAWERIPDLGDEAEPYDDPIEPPADLHQRRRNPPTAP